MNKYKFAFYLIINSFKILLSQEISHVILNNNQPFLQNKKIELAIKIDSVSSMKIYNFVEKSSENVLNPYLEWEIKVFGIFTHLESGKEMEIDAFYFQDFDVYEERVLPKPINGKDYSDLEYSEIGYWIKKDLDYDFLLRFVPEMSGNWTYRLKVKTEDLNYESESISIYVNESNLNSSITVHENQRNLKLGNDIFIPNGLNACWPETYRQFDPELFNYHIYKVNGIEYYKPEYYRLVNVIPRVYSVYQEKLKEFSKYKINYVRTIMSPVSTEIEWEYLGDYTNRLHQARELDYILETAENHNIYLHWNLETHFTFKYGVYHIEHWDWDDSDGTQTYCYKKELNLDKPYDFFTNDTAKKYYKQRLRYIISRYGYSNNIGVFELISEINNIGNKDDKGNDYYEENPGIYQSWMEEMALYIKSHYYGKKHLLTASYAGSKSKKDFTFQNSNFDLMTSNLYDYGKADGANFYKTEILKNHLNTNKETENSYYKDSIGNNHIKPFILSEFEPMESLKYCSESMIDMNRAIWQSHFSGVAGALSWSNWYFTSNYEIYKQINQFIEKFNLKTISWTNQYLLEEKNEVKFINNIDNQYNNFDLIYMYSLNKNKAIGIITNQTVKSYNEDNCLNTIDKIQRKIVNVSKHRLQIPHLVNQEYKIEYFLPDNLEKAFYTQKTRRNKVVLKPKKIGKTAQDYIVLFKIS